MYTQSIPANCKFNYRIQNSSIESSAKENQNYNSLATNRFREVWRQDLLGEKQSVSTILESLIDKNIK